MKKAMIMIALFMLSFKIQARYFPLELYKMAIKADKIVYGTIINLKTNTYTLKIEGSLTSDSGYIEVKRFDNYSCSIRWTEYKVGQSLFLFLQKRNGQYVSMSAGNEGELPMLGYLIFIHGRSIPYKNSLFQSDILFMGEKIFFETDSYYLYGGNFYGLKFNLDKFIKVVSFIRKTFDFEYEYITSPKNWTIKCALDEIDKDLSESKLIRLVYAVAMEPST